jgi:hypothetical protein
MSETETVKKGTSKGTQPLGTEENASYGEYVRLVNVRIQATRDVCEKLGELLQKHTGLMLTGMAPEKGDPSVWRQYLTCPIDKVFKA